MSAPVRVALLGFTPFEREHIERALRTPRCHKPVYDVRINDLQSCSLAVVDADHEPAVVQVLHQQRLACAVMVGGAHHPAAGAQLPRPIHLPSLLQTLDGLVGQAPPMSAEVQRVQAMLASLLDRPSTEGSKPAEAATAWTAWTRETAGPTAWPVVAGPDADQRPRRGTALLVDGRDDKLQYLAQELAPLGLEVLRVAGGSEALARLQTEVFEFVFLATGGNGTDGPDGANGADGADRADGANGANSADGANGGIGANGADEVDAMDGFHTCRLLQRMPPAQPVAPPPTLVLMLAGDTGVNRLRAERAGADAWLTPPWSTEALLKIVDERERWLRQNASRTG